MSEFTNDHVDDWLDAHTTDESELPAKLWLEKFRAPSHKKDEAWLAAHALLCTYQGTRHRVAGCSVMGDVWLSVDLENITGHDYRVSIARCSEWAMHMTDGSVVDMHSPWRVTRNHIPGNSLAVIVDCCNKPVFLAAAPEGVKDHIVALHNASLKPFVSEWEHLDDDAESPAKTERCCHQGHVHAAHESNRALAASRDDCDYPCECPQCVAHYRAGGYVPSALSEKYRTRGDDEEIPADAHLHDDPVHDGRISHSEGWDLFDIDSTGILEIQRDDEAAKFPDDEAAVAFVRSINSPYHRKAIAIHESHAAEALLHRVGAVMRDYLADADRWERTAIEAKRDVTYDHELHKWAWYDRETREDRSTWHVGFRTRVEALADAIAPLLKTPNTRP